jgi:hypothetical protein
MAAIGDAPIVSVTDVSEMLAGCVATGSRAHPGVAPTETGHTTD